MIGRVLVLLTSTNQITLKNGELLDTGYDQFALVEVADHLKKEGLGIDIGSIEGHTPKQAPNCLNHLPKEDLKYYKQFMETDPSMLLPKDITEMGEEMLHHYVGLFIPGGYAALEELCSSPDVLKLLKHFHNHQKPIGIIGAGAAALIHNEIPWLFSNYKMTCLNGEIESELEEHLLHAKLPFHVGYILEQLGARTSYNLPLETHVIEHSELITAQNKYSSYDFAVQFALKIKYSLRIPN